MREAVFETVVGSNPITLTFHGFEEEFTVETDSSGSTATALATGADVGVHAVGFTETHDGIKITIFFRKFCRC